MPETKQELVNVELTKTEIFQLHLSVVTRTANATINWANSVDSKEQEALQGLISYLNGLANKLMGYLKDEEN